MSLKNIIINPRTNVSKDVILCFKVIAPLRSEMGVGCLVMVTGVPPRAWGLFDVTTSDMTRLLYRRTSYIWLGRYTNELVTYD